MNTSKLKRKILPKVVCRGKLAVAQKVIWRRTGSDEPNTPAGRFLKLNDLFKVCSNRRETKQGGKKIFDSD